MKQLKPSLSLTGWVICLIALTATKVSAQTLSQHPTGHLTEPTMSVSAPTNTTTAAYENFQNGNLTRAVQQWTQAIREEQDIVRSLFNRSQAFIMLEQYDFALQDINQIIDIEGSRTGQDVYLIQGIVLGNLDRFSEALASFEQAAHRQQSPLIYSNRALIYQRAGDLQSALSDLEKAIELAPTPVNYLNLANLHIQLENFDTAIDHIDKLLAADSNFFPAYLTRGIARYHLGDYQPALQDFLSVLTVTSNQPEARYYAGLSLAALDMREEASQSLLAAADIYLQQNRGDSYYQVLDMMSQLDL